MAPNACIQGCCRGLRGLAKFTYESVRLWFRRLKEAFPKPEQKYRRVVAADETKLKVNGGAAVRLGCNRHEDQRGLACRVSGRGTLWWLKPSSERFWKPVRTSLSSWWISDRGILKH